MNIFLLGFMGSGKSSLGRKLSLRLDREFLDLDGLIEEKTGQSINAIFSEKGEAFFRMVETEMLEKINAESVYVISLGGGAPCSEVNFNHIKDKGMSIYIKEPEEILFGRLRGNKKDRPLIANLSDEALKQFISDKLSDRRKYYERADFIYEKDKTSWPFLISQIENYIK